MPKNTNLTASIKERKKGNTMLSGLALCQINEMEQRSIKRKIIKKLIINFAIKDWPRSENIWIRFENELRH